MSVQKRIQKTLSCQIVIELIKNGCGSFHLLYYRPIDFRLCFCFLSFSQHNLSSVNISCERQHSELISIIVRIVHFVQFCFLSTAPRSTSAVLATMTFVTISRATSYGSSAAGVQSTVGTSWRPRSTRVVQSDSMIILDIILMGSVRYVRRSWHRLCIQETSIVVLKTMQHFSVFVAHHITFTQRIKMCFSCCQRSDRCVHRHVTYVFPRSRCASSARHRCFI